VNKGVRRVSFEIITNPDKCSIKRAAWAYGCSKNGSEEERQLLDILVSKIKRSAPTLADLVLVRLSFAEHTVQLRALELGALHGITTVDCPVCNGTADPQCGCDGTMAIQEAIDWHKCQLEILSK